MYRYSITTSIIKPKKWMPCKRSWQKYSLFLSIMLSVLFTPGPSGPDAVYDMHSSHVPILPSNGRCIYTSNTDSPSQLYIIGMAHRDTFTKASNDYSLQSQLEVYRIAEWLIKNKGIELLLPEGYFMSASKDQDNTSTAIETVHPALSPAKLLENDTVYTNAEMLLMKNYGIKSRQIEDRDLYYEVKKGIALLSKKPMNKFEALHIMSGIEYLQSRRTALMLQNIPDVINDEFNRGRIENKSAIFTVGLQHIHHIIDYLQKKEITVYSPVFYPSYTDYVSELKLLREDYGVTVIIPESLAEIIDSIG